MKTSIKKVSRKEDEQVVIACLEVTAEVRDIYSYATTKGTELSGWKGDLLSRFRLEDVCYFEAVDEKSFAYTIHDVFELKLRLYEIESAYEPYHFVRCSKSMVINLMKLDSIRPALNGRFLALMENGEKVMISRQYAPGIRKIVMGGK